VRKELSRNTLIEATRKQSGRPAEIGGGGKVFNLTEKEKSQENKNNVTDTKCNTPSPEGGLIRDQRGFQGWSARVYYEEEPRKRRLESIGALVRIELSLL